MADLNKNININVNTTGIDNATKSVDNLTNATQKLETTTKDFSKGVKIVYDSTGKAIDAVTDSSQRLNRQSSALVNAMAILTAQGKQNTTEFTLLQKKHLELATTIDKTKGSSKDLFGTLSLIPGPVGEIASSFQGAIEVMKVFSNVSFASLKTQLGETIGVLKGFLGLGGGAEKPNENSEATKEQTEALKEQNKALENNHEAFNGNAAAAKQYTDEIKNQNFVTKEQIKNEGYVFDAEGKLVKSKDGLTTARSRAMAASLAEGNAVNVNTGEIIENTAATEAATVATTAWAVALGILEAALVALGIGAVIILVIKLYDVVKEAALGTKELNAELKNFSEGLDDMKDGLDKSLTVIENINKSKLDDLRKTNASAKTIREEELKGVKEQAKYLKDELERSKKTTQDGLDEYIRLGEGLKNRIFNSSERQKAGENYKKALEYENQLTKQNVAIKQELIDKGADDELNTSKENATKRTDLLNTQIKENLDKQKIDVTNLEKNLKEKANIEAYWGHYSAGKRKEQLDDIAKQVAQANATNQEREIQGTIDTLQSQLITYKEHSTKDFAVRRQIAEEEYKKDMAAASVALGNRTNLEKEALNKRNQNLKNLSKEKDDFDKQFIKMQEDLYTNDLNDSLDREKQTNEQKYREQRIELEKELDLIELSEDRKNEIRGRLDEAYHRDKAVIDEKYNKRDADRRAEHLTVMSEIDKASITGFFKYYQDQQDLLKAQQDAELANTELTEQEKADIKLKYAQKSKDLQKSEIEDIVGFGTKILGAAGSIFDQMSQVNQMAEQQELSHAQGNAEQQDQIKRKYFEKNKQAQIGSTIISTLEASVNAYESLAPIPFVGPVLGAAAAAAALVFGYEKVSLIKNTQYESSNTAATQTRLKNYGDGGVIEGPSHASSQGGVKVNAEGGEAIINKNSVAMFKPMLSMINQMGGGTSFQKGAAGMAGYDSPKGGNTQPQDQPIFKTYVVENELTTMQARQSRLKEISTL